MKAVHHYADTGRAIGFSMLIGMSLVACDQGAEPNIAATRTEANEVKTDNNAGVKNGSKPTEAIIITNSDGYSAGYDFGSQLAQQTGIKLDEVFRGLCDALSGQELGLDVITACAALPVIEQSVADNDPPQFKARTGAFKDDFAALNAMREGVVILPSGVQYEVLKDGSGRKPGENDTVIVSYEATLANGTVFDTTAEDEEPMLLQMNEIAVPGLKEALLLMKEGARWRVVIPPSAGFARSGNNMLRRRDLIYDIELISIQEPGSS